jgi:osmotically-inducible protein OsmY
MLHVIPAPVSDQEIRRSCRRLLRSGRRVDEKGISLSVDRGQLVFKGSDENRQQLGRLQKLAANLRGVRDVRVEVIVSKEKRGLDQRATSRLGKLVSEVFPGQDVELSLFGGVAVLTGTIRNLRARRAVEAFVAEDPMVTRVVNKLEVES